MQGYQALSGNASCDGARKLKNRPQEGGIKQRSLGIGSKSRDLIFRSRRFRYRIRGGLGRPKNDAVTAVGGAGSRCGIVIGSRSWAGRAAPFRFRARRRRMRKGRATGPALAWFARHVSGELYPNGSSCRFHSTDPPHASEISPTAALPSLLPMISGWLPARPKSFFSRHQVLSTMLWATMATFPRVFGRRLWNG